MASRSIHIVDYERAIRDNVIPGKFIQDDSGILTSYQFPSVVSINSKGAKLVWSVQVRLLENGVECEFDTKYLIPGTKTPEDITAEITTESYQISASGVKGKIREGGKPTIVKLGKNIGKSNETNVVTQALRDALSKYNLQKKKSSPGESEDTKGASAQEVPMLNPPPMLVKKIGDSKDATLTADDFVRGVTIQRKYNGVRVVARLDGDQVVLYSRTKGNYAGINHIRAELLDALTNAPPVVKPDSEKSILTTCPPYLDGEIYLHGKSLSWISGQARREQDDSSLEYVIFDCFFPDLIAEGYDMPSSERQAYLDTFFEKTGLNSSSIIKRAENFPVQNMEEIMDLSSQFLEENYEGAIARKDAAGYRYSTNNYHSANLLKIKPLFDSEFPIVGYTEGSKGKDIGAVIWICEVDPEHVVDKNDMTFSVVPKDMSYDTRKLIFKCLGEEVEPGITRFIRDFLGKPLTVEYPERSVKTGKPVQAKALTIRTYEGNLAEDPLKKLYEECSP